MADINDISTTIAAALIEVGISGKLEVKMDGDKAVAVVGDCGGDDVKIAVAVTPVRE